MTDRLTPEQVREALEIAARSAETHGNRIVDAYAGIVSEAEDCFRTAAILRRLLDSGFVEKAMEYCDGTELEELTESIARLNATIAAYRLLQSGAKEKP